MTILVLNHEYPPVGGGSGRATHNIVSELLRRGHKVVLLTCKYSGFTINAPEGLKVYEVYGSRKSNLANNHYITFPAYIFLGYLKALRIVKKDRVDIIHCFMGMPAGIIGMMIKKTTGIPYILSLRGSDVPYWDNSSMMIRLRHLIAKVWKNADRVIALSKGHRAAAARTMEGAKELFGVIYNGVSEDFFTNADEKTDNKKIIITVARLVELKGIQDVLKALAILRKEDTQIDMEYRIIGEGPYMKKLEEIVNDENLGDIVKFAGYMTKKDTQMQYAVADLFVLTSYSEAFGQVFLEAMASGVPVIGSMVGGIPEIVTAKTGILVEAGNDRAIASAITDVLEKKVEFAKEDILKRAADFTWSNIVDQYELEYKEIMSR